MCLTVCVSSYEWFRHIQGNQPTSLVICTHNAAPIYAAVRALSHNAIAGIHVQKIKHSTSFCSLDFPYVCLLSLPLRVALFSAAACTG